MNRRFDIEQLTTCQGVPDGGLLYQMTELGLMPDGEAADEIQMVAAHAYQATVALMVGKHLEKKGRELLAQVESTVQTWEP